MNKKKTVVVHQFEIHRSENPWLQMSLSKKFDFLPNNVGLGGIVACLAGGALSDQIGRKPAMVIFTMLTLFSVVPAFRAIVHYRTALALLGWVAVLSILGEFWTSPLLVWLVESLRLQSRFAWRNGDRGRSCL
jgi:hypothetical protein